MAVRRPEAGSPAAAAVVIGGSLDAEPAPTTADCSYKRSRTDPVDTDFDERKEKITSSDRFPKYVDCQETLVELSFIKWIAGFRYECRRLAAHKSTELFYGLLNFFCVNIVPEVVDCRNKINKSTLLKNYVEQVLLFFHQNHKYIKTSDALDAVYYDKMSSLLAHFIDLKLMATQRYKDKSWHKKTSSKINSTLSIFLDENIDHMFDSIFQLYYIFYGSINISHGSVILPVFKRLLAERPIPTKMKFLTYLRYILCFKLWKKTVHSSNLDSSNKRKEIEQIRLLLRGLNPPHDFMSQHEKYKWSNWPKLTMSLNGTPATVERDLKNVTIVLYSANLSLKDCIKDILDVSRKDISTALNSVEQQCLILRPDLFSIEGNEMLETWNSNFDMTLKPLIPVTRSCNSLMRKIKYNLYSDKNDTNRKFPISQLLINIKNNTHKLDNSGENSENVSICDKLHNEKSNDINSLKSKVIDENKQDENESTVRVLKTVFVNGESFPVNIQQSNEDEILVNTKKLKSSEKNVVLCQNEDVHRLDTLSSNFDKSDCTNESVTHQTHGAGCSSIISKGSKRTLSTSFSESETCKRFSKTKSRHEKNLMIGNQNQNIDSDCQKNSKLECVDCVTLQNNNDLSFDYLENSLDTSVGSCLMNESLVRENKWVTKVSSEMNVTSTLNLDYSQSNFLDSDKERNAKKCISKGIELDKDQDSLFSPPSDIQWPLKLSPCDPSSPECKPIINSSEQMEVDIQSSNIEGINSPKTEHLLSLRHSEELISKLVSSRHSINENEHTQIYALPIDQKLAHVEHPYVENAINSSTRDLEVVNVLSPVSINSTDIPMNKSSWVPDLSLIHAHNDVDVDHSRSSNQQLNGLCNSINSNRISNYSSEVEHFNHVQLETPIMSRSCSYNRIEPRIFDSYNLSPNESSVSNSAYGSIYDVSRLTSSVSLKTIPISVASKDITHDSSNSLYCGNTINLSFNGLKQKSTKEQQSYNFAINKTRQPELGSFEKLSLNIKDRSDIDVVSDEFSDVNSIDLRVNSAESKKINSCANSLSMSNLISNDLKLANTLSSSFNQSLSWSTIKNPSESSNLHQNQKLKIYSDPNELILGPMNVNKQSGISINLNEAHVQKVFLGNKSPSQLYYSPMDMDMANHGNVDDSKAKHFTNKSNSRNHVTTCTNDKYIHSVLSPTDNDPTVNNGSLYQYARSDSNSSVGFENPHQLPHQNQECLSPNGLTLKSLDQMTKLGPILLEDSSLNDEQAINMAQLMLQSNKNCKVHYKWPLNKNKSQVFASNVKDQETPQNVEYKRNVLLSKYSEDEINQTRLQNMSPNEILNQNSGLSFNERNNDDSTTFQPNQQFQDLSNLIESDLSPTIHSGSDSTDDNNSRKESTDQQKTMHRNPKIPSQNQDTTTTLSREVFEAARYLFNKDKLFLCMHPKCINSHHFRVIPSNAEMLRHEFTVPFDDFRFNIQYKYKQLLTSNPRTWPRIPELVQLNKRCLCEICGDFDSKLNQNQEMLHTYVEGKKPSIEEDNNENELPSNPQLRLSWKKNLANRFSSEAIAKQSISQMIDDMERHIQRFTHAFTIIFALSKDVKINSQSLQNACESYLDVNDDSKSLNSECVTKLDISHTHFNKDLHLYSYQYLQLPKVVPKYVLEELSNSSYQPPNHNVLNIPHQFDEEHLPNNINRYFVENSISPSYNSNLANQSLNYVQENMPNTSRQSVVDNSPSTSHQSSVENLTSSSHQSILNKFPTSHGISCSSLNDITQKHSHMSCYYSDGQIYTEFPHTYLPVPSAQFANSSTSSYYNSPVNLPSDNSVPFCSPSLSVNSVPNSPSSDCSIPSLVETVATAVPEHALLDDSLEAVNAAHNLMLISNRHRYNSTTSVKTTNNTDIVTVTTATTTTIVSNTKTSTDNSRTNTISSTNITKSSIVTTDNIMINNNIPSPNSVNHNMSSTNTITDIVHAIKIEPDDEDSDIIHNSRKKKKKKHDKKKDKKKKGKR